MPSIDFRLERTAFFDDLNLHDWKRKKRKARRKRLFDELFKVVTDILTVELKGYKVDHFDFDGGFYKGDYGNKPTLQIFIKASKRPAWGNVANRERIHAKLVAAIRDYLKTINEAVGKWEFSLWILMGEGVFVKSKVE